MEKLGNKQHYKCYGWDFLQYLQKEKKTQLPQVVCKALSCYDLFIKDSVEETSQIIYYSETGTAGHHEVRLVGRIPIARNRHMKTSEEHLL